MEMTYILNSGNAVSFYDEEESQFGCLCTFPFNDTAAGDLSKGRVASLALPGAAVALSANMGDKSFASDG